MSLDISFPGDETPAQPTGPVSPEVVKKYLGVVKGFIVMVKPLIALTKTKDDDAILEGVEKAIAFIEPYADQPWVYDLLNVVIGLFKSGSPKEAALAIIAAAQAFAAK